MIDLEKKEEVKEILDKLGIKEGGRLLTLGERSQVIKGRYVVLNDEVMTGYPKKMKESNDFSNLKTYTPKPDEPARMVWKKD